MSRRMIYGGHRSLRTAVENARLRARAAAQDPTKSEEDCPEHRARPDLRDVWLEEYRRERLRYVRSLVRPS